MRPVEIDFFGQYYLWSLWIAIIAPILATIWGAYDVTLGASSVDEASGMIVGAMVSGIAVIAIKLFMRYRIIYKKSSIAAAGVFFVLAADIVYLFIYILLYNNSVNSYAIIYGVNIIFQVIAIKYLVAPESKEWFASAA